MHDFVARAPVAIAMLDCGLHYLAASPRWRADYRLGDVPLVGRSHYEVFPETPERKRPIHRRCLADAVEYDEEGPFVRADGATQWLRWQVQPWRGVSGEVGGLFFLTEDITHQKDIEATTPHPWSSGSSRATTARAQRPSRSSARCAGPRKAGDRRRALTDGAVPSFTQRLWE